MQPTSTSSNSSGTFSNNWGYLQQSSTTLPIVPLYPTTINKGVGSYLGVGFMSSVVRIAVNKLALDNGL